MRGLEYRTVLVPIGAAGLNTKADPRALPVPELSIAKDVEFTELGGIQTRYPFSAMANDTIEDETTLSNARRIVPNGDELLVFTKESLYSWNARLSKWSLRGTHLAVKVDETSRFVTTGDQIECDRAELNGTVFYAWRDLSYSLDVCYVAAIDKVTGSVRVAPQQIASASKPRLTALATKVLLTYVASGSLWAHAIDPDDPVPGIVGAATDLGGCSTYYDITRVLGADQAAYACRQSPATSHLVGTVTAGLTVASSVKARTCDGVIAVSSHPSGTHVQVVRTDINGGGPAEDIVGDLVLISGLSDVYTGQAIGSYTNTVYQIACAHRSTQDSSQYRCYVFWASLDSGSTGQLVKYNWVDTGNTLGSQANFLRGVGIASRAFDRSGRIFVNLVFAGVSDAAAQVYGQRAALQNTYFLYRDDATLVAKQAALEAGGFPSRGHLPAVVLTDTDAYSWCGTERRLVELGGKAKGYEDRGPRDITLTFDSNEARRCARLGQTLYISGGEVLQYDGRGLYEVGFHTYPHYVGAVDGAGGSIAAGTYYYKVTQRWNNARAEADRSTSATVVGVSPASGSRQISVTNVPLYVTHKTLVGLEVWRTETAPTDDAPYYLTTSKDPADTAAQNGYLQDDAAADQQTFVDALADTDLRDRESHRENGAILENLAPPAATIIAASQTRLYLAGIPGRPNQIWYSRPRGDGELAAFHELLVVDVPPDGGRITGLALLQETLVAFCETAVYMLPGDGYDNAGGGSNFGPARTVSVDVGAVNHDSIAVLDKGVVFKSSKGWYLLNRGWALEYIGAAVADHDSETPLAVHVLEGKHQVRILTASRMLVLDTYASEAMGRPMWSEWTISDGLHAAIWSGTYHYLTTTGPKAEQTSYSSASYGWDIELAWLKLAEQLLGFGRVEQVQLLGEYRAAGDVRVRLARDYWKDGVDTYFQDKTWTVTPTVVGGPMQLKHGPSIQQMQALKIRLTATPSSTGESPRLTALALRIGFDPNLARLPAAQRQ